MSRFDVIKAENIVAKLAGEFSDCLKSFEYDLQDGFDTLLVMCQLSVEPTDDFLQTIHTKLRSSMQSLVDCGDESICWMVNVYYRNELVESAIP